MHHAPVDGLSWRIEHGFAPGAADQAARLYWQAFGAKLGVLLGPEPRALRFLTRTIRADHAFAAVGPDGTVLGVAGYCSNRGSLVRISHDTLRAAYGPVGALWRAALIWALTREVENRRFLLDGICVAEPCRGRGMGRALLHAICAEARARGYAEVRLDVVEHNRRAIALYEREGFVAVRRSRLGLLRYVFGFRASITMVRPV
ncbi:GNAT family N-acetyltransferase [Ruixingdingia sedimenti]